MALFSRYFCSVDQTSSSPSRHSVYTKRKTASRNPCKNLSVIQRSDKMLWPFWADTQGWRPDILATQKRFHCLPRENSLCKTLKKFEWDPTVGPKVMAFFSRNSCSTDYTSSSLSSQSITTPKKTASQNPYKNFSAIKRSDQKLWPFWVDTHGCQPDMLVTQHRFHCLPRENSLSKPL
jgi:hypothetical protein